MRSTTRRLAALTCVVVVAAAACGSTAALRTAASTSKATPVGTSVVSTTAVSRPAAPTSPGAGTQNGFSYATKVFAMPFDVTVPASLQPEPGEEQPHFVTWHDRTNPDRAVRFLIPLNLYPPGATRPTPPPHDYLTYLLAQADHGAHFADQTQATVGGRPATIVTATVDRSLDGSLGCPEDAIAAPDCFGLQPELVLRIAVIDIGGKTLLIWLRNNTSVAGSMTTEIDSFNQLLSSVQFSDRAIQAPTAAVATVLDGAYRWTITKDDALAHGTPGDKTPESLALFPWVFTITMSNGRWSLHHTEHDVGQDDGGGSYAISGNRIDLHQQGNTNSFAFTRDDDGTLHLDPIPPMDTGDQFVMATNPWSKIG